MKANEASDIARRLTQQWRELLRSKVVKNNNIYKKSFLRHLEANGRIVFEYESQELLDRAMDVIPLQILYEEAEARLEDATTESSLEDQVIQRLLSWFKKDFFRWVNNAPCDYCHNKDTRFAGLAQPNDDDTKYGALVVETYQCLSCKNITRFPRYNDPGKLLETRRGRCGEWANCFTLCCRAVGAEARIVYDTTDHVWTEVYSEFEQRWIHCDACEEAWDKPLLYSVGWNKQLNYCTAYSVNEVLDVTKRYIKNWPQVLKRRNKVAEAELHLYLHDLTVKRQVNMSQEQKKFLEDRLLRELMELEDESKKQNSEDAGLVERQSGSLAWRTSRGEAGTAAENIMNKSCLDKSWESVSLSVSEGKNNCIFLGNASILTNSTPLIPNNPIIRITRAVSDQKGAVYHKQAIEINDKLKGLEVDFAFRVTDGSGSADVNGADGFAFVIQGQGENALGEGGCELGYGGITKSLAIEFDTYQSSDRCDDPSGNHISIQGRLPPFGNSAHHNYSLGHTSRIPSLQNGKWMKASIRLLTTGQIEVGLAEVNDDGFVQVLKIENQSFVKYLGSSTKAWVGFTASTGGLSQNHDIQIVSIIEYRSHQ